MSCSVCLSVCLSVSQSLSHPTDRSGGCDLRVSHLRRTSFYCSVNLCTSFILLHYLSLCSHPAGHPYTILPQRMKPCGSLLILLSVSLLRLFSTAGTLGEASFAMMQSANFLPTSIFASSSSYHREAMPFCFLCFLGHEDVLPSTQRFP